MRELLARHGIPIVDERFAHDPNAAAASADELGYPIVAKILSPRHSHKSDVGGVRTGLSGRDAVREAAAELLAILGPEPAEDEGVVVQPQARGRELIAGIAHDEHFGAIVLLGPAGSMPSSSTTSRLRPCQSGMPTRARCSPGSAASVSPTVPAALNPSTGTLSPSSWSRFHA